MWCRPQLWAYPVWDQLALIDVVSCDGLADKIPFQGLKGKRCQCNRLLARALDAAIGHIAEGLQKEQALRGQLLQS